MCRHEGRICNTNNEDLRTRICKNFSCPFVGRISQRNIILSNHSGIGSYWAGVLNRTSNEAVQNRFRVHDFQKRRFTDEPRFRNGSKTLFFDDFTKPAVQKRFRISSKSYQICCCLNKIGEYKDWKRIFLEAQIVF